jgi:ribose 5-phosphate isomerase A
MGTHDDGRTRAWEAAGRHAAALVNDGDRVGLGTGRAAAAGIRALADRVADGLRCVGVPTSKASRALGRELGLRVAGMREPVDIAFDGADLVTPGGLIIKGAGGAIVRERVVDASAGRFLVLVDAPKVADSLDAWGILPIAVIPFAADHVAFALAELRPTRRAGRSDDNLVVMDLAIPAGSDWTELDGRIRGVPGVVDTGLFRVDPDDVLVGTPDGGVRPLGEFAREARG